MNRRLIARLDIKGPNLVKGIHLEGLRVLGRPEDFARYYSDQGADELLYMDIVASLYNRNSLSEIITRTAQECFIPLTVGGGLRTLDDIRKVLRAGADKIAINTAAVKNPHFIEEAALRFGSSTVVVSIEAIRQSNGTYLAYTENGREHTGLEVREWAYKAQSLGAGEILLTSVDKEGTGTGMDLELTALVSKELSIPVIASGGVGNIKHVEQVLKETEVSAIALASLIHYEFVQSHSLGDVSSIEGNTEFRRNGTIATSIEPCNFHSLKGSLRDAGISVRPSPMQVAT